MQSYNWRGSTYTLHTGYMKPTFSQHAVLDDVLANLIYLISQALKFTNVCYLCLQLIDWNLVWDFNAFKWFG